MRSRVVALVLAAAAGCSRCGERSAASAEELLPGHPDAALVSVPLGALAQHLLALSDRVSSLPGGEQAGEARRGLSAQLGFDPLTPQGLASAGLDAQRSAAVVFGGGQGRPGWIAAVPVEKPDLFLQTVERLAQRAGFTRAADPAKGARLYEGRGQRLGVSVVRGFGIVARTTDPAAALAEVGAQAPEQALARDPGLDGARKRLGTQDLIVWAPAGSAFPRRYTSRSLPGEVALSLQGSAQGLAMRSYAALPPAQAQSAQAALPGGGASLVELLPPDAPLRARLGIAPARLLESLRREPELADVLARLRGADAEAVAAVAPGVVVSLALARGANIGAAIDYGFDWRQRSPFATVQLVALAEVTDRPRLLRAFERIGEAMPPLGARVERRGEDFQVTYAAGAGARFGIRDIEGKAVAYLMGGPLRPEELRRSPRSTNPEAAALYENGGAALRIDFGKLALAVRELPQDAYGSGPQAYVARSFAAQVIEPLRTVRLTFAAEPFSDRLGATLDVELVAP